MAEVVSTGVSHMCDNSNFFGKVYLVRGWACGVTSMYGVQHCAS